MVHQDIPEPRRMARTRSRSDAPVPSPSALPVHLRPGRERRGSFSSFSTFVSNKELPPDAWKKSVNPHHNEEFPLMSDFGLYPTDDSKKEKKDEDAEPEEGYMSIKETWKEFIESFREYRKMPRLYSPPPSPGNPGLAVSYLRDDPQAPFEQDVVNHMMGNIDNSLMTNWFTSAFKGGRRRKKKAKKITAHISHRENRLGFLLNLAHALLIFNFPSHRIYKVLTHAADVLDVDVKFVQSARAVQVYYPQEVGKRNLKHGSGMTLVMPSKSGLDLGRIQDIHGIYLDVVRDHIFAYQGSLLLMKVMLRDPAYTPRLDFFLGWIQGFILCGSAFGGSPVDMLVSGALNFCVTIIQRVSKKAGLSKCGADIWSSAFVSATARALSSALPGRFFCYSAISSAAVSGLLPGSVMLGGIMDIASAQYEVGGSKIVSGLLTSLTIGFGLTFGSDFALLMVAGAESDFPTFQGSVQGFQGSLTWQNSSIPAMLPAFGFEGAFTFYEETIINREKAIQGCLRDPHDSWIFQPIPLVSLLVLIPIINLIASLRRGLRLKSAAMLVSILISCACQAVTKTVVVKFGLTGHPDYIALLGSVIVSMLGNLYAIAFGGTAYSVMAAGIWLLIPSGLASAGGLTSTYEPGQDEYTQALELARKMLSTIVGCMAGVFLSSRFLAFVTWTDSPTLGFFTF